MRITGGVLSGRQIIVPKGIIRPSMDKMRESVFATLQDISGLSFLDIFSGSGIIALEAASRGASYIEAVEADPLKRNVLIENVSISPIRINCKFISAEMYVKRSKTKFDLIFLDPPFNYKYKWELLENIVKSNLVSNESQIMMHRPKEDFQTKEIINLKIKTSKKYGRSIVDFFIVDKI